jgi:hypothetical protein
MPAIQVMAKIRSSYTFCVIKGLRPNRNVGTLEYWVSGKFVLPKNNNGITSLKKIYYSIIPISHGWGKNLKLQKITHVFIELQKFRDV